MSRVSLLIPCEGSHRRPAPLAGRPGFPGICAVCGRHVELVRDAAYMWVVRDHQRVDVLSAIEDADEGEPS